MTRLIRAILIALLVSAPAFAQISTSYVYVVGGPVVVPKSAFTRWDGEFIHVAGGGEGRLTGRVALGGEIGAIMPVTNDYAETTGLASVTPAWHFFSKRTKTKFDPFVGGGLTFLFGNGVGAGFHYGGGLNYWLKRRIGLRFEFRDHPWFPEGGEVVHLVDFRVGIVLGMH